MRLGLTVVASFADAGRPGAPTRRHWQTASQRDRATNRLLPPADSTPRQVADNDLILASR
jgi:hypothetical protein